MANLSSLNFRLSANISPFQKGLNKAERSMDKLGRKMQQTGKNLSMRLTAPIAALGAMSFSVFKGFEAEMSKVQAVSGATAKSLKRYQIMPKSWEHQRCFQRVRLPDYKASLQS